MNLHEDDRMYTFAYPSRTTPERRAALESLGKDRLEAIGELRAGHLLPEPPWPSLAEGRVLGGDDLVVMAVCMPAGRVAAVLEAAGDEDVERVVLAVRMAEAAARYDRAAVERFEPLVRAQLSDARIAFPQAPCPSLTLGAYAQEYHLRLASWFRVSDPARYLQLLELAMAGALARAMQMDALYNVLLAWLCAGADCARPTALFLATLSDPAAPPATRAAAREAIDIYSSVANHPDGVPAGTREAVEEAKCHAAERLGDILRAPDTPPALRDLVLPRLHRWAPAMLVKLQREGMVPVVPVPSRRTHKDWTPAGVELLSTRVSFDEVLALLAGPPEPDLDRVITALRIAPALAAWLPGAAARLVPLMQALLPNRLPVPMKSGPHRLGDMALEQYVRLFPPLDSQEPWMQEALREGLLRARAAGASFDKVADFFPHLCSRTTLRSLRA